MGLKLKLAACLFAALEALMLAGQITTLVSTYWTSWDLRFYWTQGRDFTRRPQTDGELVSEGHAGLWSRCVRVYEAGREPAIESPTPFTCLHNYDTSNGSLRFTFGKACKTATAALCVGDGVVIVMTLVLVVLAAFRRRSSSHLLRVALCLLLLQGLMCFTIPITYLSGNMAELIEQLSAAYGLLLVVRMTPWYTHDWGFWTQVGLIGLWTLAVAVFVALYGLGHSRNCSKHSKALNGHNEHAEDTEMEALKG